MVGHVVVHEVSWAGGRGGSWVKIRVGATGQNSARVESRPNGKVSRRQYSRVNASKVMTACLGMDGGTWLGEKNQQVIM